MTISLRLVCISRRVGILLSCIALLWSCTQSPSSDPTSPDLATEFKAIIVNDDGSGFTDSEGNRFRPWGFNYTGTVEYPLLEDEWEDEASWIVFEEDMREMRAYHANTIRLHLQLHHYMDGVGSIKQENMLRLQRLVSLAADNNLYVNLTGLAAYRKSEQPDWYVNLTEADRWRTQANFWTAIAEQLAGQANVFAYNLMNEPVAVDVIAGDWLPGDGFGEFHFVQSVTVDTADREPSEILRNWMQVMVNAIRSKDNNTLITVGFLPLGNYSQYADVLDYLSPHYYPERGMEQASIDHLVANRAGVPIVVEEIFSLFTGVEETAQFILDTDSLVAGYFSHYNGLTVEALNAENTLPDAIRAAWLLRFSELSEQLNE